ncbi:UNVERIFIED_CONTAM: hypothetical protein FKN15_066326 [Acipenser sinensis]
MISHCPVGALPPWSPTGEPLFLFDRRRSVIRDIQQSLELELLGEPNVALQRYQTRPPEDSGSWADGDRLPPGHTVSQLETCKIRSIKAGTLERLVETLLTAFGDNDFTYISIFLSTYRAFASPADVLGLLLDNTGSETTAHETHRNWCTFHWNWEESGSVVRECCSESEELSGLRECCSGSEELSELFKRVIPHHCLGSIWSQRDKKENKHIVPTVRATITQFNALTKCVVCTVLRDRDLKPQHRARVIEKWINTAQGAMQGTVPYLGTFLTDLTMLDTALPDYVEGGLINFEKRRREFEVIAQIKLLQSACNSYCLSADQAFLRWFRSQQHLTDEESYTLSCEIEGVADSSPTSPKPRKSMVKRLSLLFLGTDAVASSTPVKESPKSPPSGSSGESMDSVSVSSSDSSPSELEVACQTPDAPLKKLSESSSCSSIHSMDTSSSFPSLPEPPPTHRRSVSGSSALPLPVYNQQNEDSCIIRVSVQASNGNLYKSILGYVCVCWGGTHRLGVCYHSSPVRSKHNLESEASDRYELVQVISEERGE